MGLKRKKINVYWFIHVPSKKYYDHKLDMVYRFSEYCINYYKSNHPYF